MKFDELICKGIIGENKYYGEDVYKTKDGYLLSVADGAGGYNQQIVTGIEYDKHDHTVAICYVSDSGNDVSFSLSEEMDLGLDIYKKVAI